MGFGDELVKFYRKNKLNESRKIQVIQAIVIPIIVGIIPLIWRDKVSSGAFVLILMSVYWIVQCIPIAVTSLLPVFLLPLFGIMPARQVTPVFFNDNIMFIFGSLLIGIGIETSGLHRKIALGICLLVGSDPKWLLLGIMCTSAFFSIWVSNAAVSSMMLPIVATLAKNLIRLDPFFKPKRETGNLYATFPTVSSRIKILNSDVNDQIVEDNGQADQSQIKASNPEANSQTDEQIQIELKDETAEFTDDDDIYKSDEAQKLLKGYVLSITIASLIGGASSLIGTPSNVFLKSYFEENHPESSLNFLTFILFAFPISVLHLISAWIMFVLWFLPKGKRFGLPKFLKRKSKDEDEPAGKSKKEDPFRQLVRREYEELGPYTWEQISIGCFFGLAALLWLTRDLHFVNGWGALFSKNYVTDASVAMFVLFLTSIWPKENIFHCESYTPLLKWSELEKIFQWNVIILLGGSLAMAEGCEKSGLSAWLGGILKDILPQSKFLILIIMMIVSIAGTEFMSNISIISILMPILEDVAKETNTNFYFILLSQSVAVNFSFMFPSASASNAIIFGSGYLTIKDMALFGLVVKLIGCVILIFISSIWLEVIFPANLNMAANLTTIIQNTTTASMTNVSEFLTTDMTSF